MRTIVGLLGMAVLCCAAPASRVAVLEKLGDSLSVYELASGRLVQRIAVGSKPHEFALTPGGQRVFVTLYGLDTYSSDAPGGNAVAVVDLAAGKKTGEVALGKYRRPHAIELGPVSRKFWITTDEPAAVLRIDPVRLQVDRTIELPDKRPHMLAISHDERTLYTANSGSASVSVVDLASGRPRTSILVGGVPMGIVLSADGRTVYVTTRSGNEVVAIDTASLQVRKRIAVSGQPVRLGFAPGGRTLLVTTIEAGDVAVLDLHTAEVVKRFPAGARAEGLLVDPEGGRLFVSAQSEDVVKLFSLKDYRQTGVLKTGAKPDPILLLPSER